MTRQVNADVVLAALREIGVGLDELRKPRAPLVSLTVSNTRQRLSRLIDQIEQQATEGRGARGIMSDLLHVPPSDTCVHVLKLDLPSLVWSCTRCGARVLTDERMP